MSRERVLPTKRRAMTKARRLAVFTAFNGYCAVCGSETPLEEGEADHELSLFLGGADDVDNLVWKCQPCHSAKTHKHDAKAHAKVRRLIKKADPENRKSRRPIKSRGFQKDLVKGLDGIVRQKEKAR